VEAVLGFFKPLNVEKHRRAGEVNQKLICNSQEGFLK
jgi:hypothetical protein